MSKISISNANLDGARKIRSQITSYVGSPLESIIDDRVVASTLQEGLDDLGYGAALNVRKYGYDGYWGASSNAALSEFRDDNFPNISLNEAVVQLASLVVDSISGDDSKFDVSSRTQNDLLVEYYERDGRQRVRVSDGTFEKEFTRFRKGWYTNGIIDVDTDYPILNAVAPIEGKMDAINTWDDSFLSVGPFQWTIGQGGAIGEFNEILHEWILEYPNLAQRYLHSHGITTEDVDDEIFIELDGELLTTPELKDKLREPTYCFIFWRLCNLDTFKDLMVSYMMKRVVDLHHINVAGGVTINELFDDDYCLAQLLQCHVNRPAYVDDYIRLAVNKVMDVSVSDLKDEVLGKSLQRRIIEEVESISHTFGKYPLTHPKKRFDAVKTAYNVSIF